MSVRVRDQAELRKLGIMVDPSDPNKAIPIGPSADRQASPLTIDPSSGSAAETVSAPPTETVGPQNTESFTRETSPGPVGDISTLDDDLVLKGMDVECEALRAIDRHYPTRYHRLGTFICESTKRFGDEYVKQYLRQKGIDGASKWRAEQIATLYSYDQAAVFPSLRAILRTLPSKQPRHPRGKKPEDGRDGARTELKEPATPATNENTLERFIDMGIKIRHLLGDEALDRAVEQIKGHGVENFDEAFTEV